MAAHALARTCRMNWLPPEGSLDKQAFPKGLAQPLRTPHSGKLRQTSTLIFIPRSTRRCRIASAVAQKKRSWLDPKLFLNPRVQLNPVGGIAGAPWLALVFLRSLGPKRFLKPSSKLTPRVQLNPVGGIAGATWLVLVFLRRLGPKIFLKPSSKLIVSRV